MPEREFKIRHTTEGADKAKADIEGIAQAEAHYKDEVAKLNAMLAGGAAGDAVDKQTKSVERAKGEVAKLSGATENLNIKKENLTNILSRIHPSLGALADTMANAGEMAGALATKNIKLSKAFAAVRASVLKNLAALKLLGAGGAAVAAIMFLIRTVQKLKKEFEEILALQKKIDAQNRKMIDKSQSVQERILDAVESRDIAPPTDAETKRIHTVTRQYEREGYSPDVAFDFAINRQAPPSAAEREYIKRYRGKPEQRKRIREELIKDKELPTKDVEYIKEQGFTEENIEKLRNMLRHGEPKGPGMFTKPRALTPDAFREKEPQLYELATRLHLLDVILERLQQMQKDQPFSLEGVPVRDWDLWEIIKRIGQFSPALGLGFAPTVRTDPETLRLFGIEPKGGTNEAADLQAAAGAVKEAAQLIGEQTRKADRTAEELRRATEELSRAARASANASEELHRGAEAQSIATDRAAAKLSRNGTTAKWESLRGGEG